MKGKSAQELIGRCFGERGFIYELAETGARLIKTDVDDLTDSQANLIDCCARDERMQKKADEVLDLADEIEEEYGLEKARPWYDEE